MRRRARACVAGMGRERASPLPSMGNEGGGLVRRRARVVMQCARAGRGKGPPSLPPRGEGGGFGMTV